MPGRRVAAHVVGAAVHAATDWPGASMIATEAPSVPRALPLVRRPARLIVTVPPPFSIGAVETTLPSKTPWSLRSAIRMPSGEKPGAARLTLYEPQMG